MSSSRQTRSESKPALARSGLLIFAIGVILLIAGGLQRFDGYLSWGPRSGPQQKLAREDAPERFDEVTLGLIAAGLILSAGGLALAYVVSNEEQGGRVTQESDG